MKNLINEIKTHFASQIRGIRPLSSMPPNYDAFTFRQGVEYGVAIKLPAGHKAIYEESAQITIRTMNHLGDEYLVLGCCDEGYRNDFAKFGAYFVEPGNNGENRKSVIDATMDWWNEWIGMLGNRVGGRNCYDTIAEMIALEEIYRSDISANWAASHAGSHDIETNTNAYEIKSTIKKTETAVTISSQFQLASNNPLELWFYRMEFSEHGNSINDMRNRLVSCGYDEHLIEAQLEKRGFIFGSSIRDRKYVVLERRKYIVDNNFPKIVESSFKNNQYPQNISKILYTINLDGLPYTT